MERQFIKRNTKNQKLLGGLYRMNGHPDLAREHMEKSISLLDQFNLLHINDSIPQIANYAMFLTEQQEPERGISELQNYPASSRNTIPMTVWIMPKYRKPLEPFI